MASGEYSPRNIDPALRTFFKILYAFFVNISKCSGAIKFIVSVKTFLFLILDGIVDPHNLGACFRVADAMGVDALICPKDNAVGLNATVRKVACGGAESVPFVVVTNLARTIRYLKDSNIFVYGTDGEAKKPLHKINFKGSIALVMGSEGKGMRRLTKELCDDIFSIPMMGQVESLNVSVASGICMYEINRQKS